MFWSERYNEHAMGKMPSCSAAAFAVVFFGFAGAVSAQSWLSLSSGVGNDLNQVFCPTEETCYVVGGAPFIGGNGVVLKTTNGGTNWISLSIPTTHPLRSIHCASESVCIAVGDGGGTILKTTNGGASWALRSAGREPTRPWFWDVRMLDALNATAVGNAGDIYRTTNGGSTWEKIMSGTSNNLHGVHFADGAIGWIMGGGTLLKTTNGGATWFPLSAPGTNLLWTAANRGGRLWIAGDTLRQSANGGATLTAMSTDVYVTYRGIAFVSDTEGVMVGGGGVIQRTVDAGASWQRETSPTNQILRDVSCFVSGLCYAVGDDGTILRRGNAPGAGTAATSTSAGTQGSSQSGTSGRALFSDNVSEMLKTKIAAGKFDKSVKKKRAVVVNAALLAGSQLNLNFFDDAQVIVDIAKRTEKNGTQVLKGTITGKPKNTATFVVKGESVAGLIHTEKGVYKITGRGGGAHVVEFVNTRLLPDDTHTVPPKRLTTQNVSSSVRITAAAPRPANAVAVVDVMVAYTPQALDALSGDRDAMEAQIELMVDEANQAFENSRAGIRLNLASVVPIAWRDFEQDSTTETLNFITNSNNVRVRSIFGTAREESRVDIATLLVAEGGNACGTAWQLNNDNVDYYAPDYALNVVDIDCIPNYAYPHEVGHNMGLGHDRSNETNTPLYSYAYGFQDPGGIFRTIMGYQCPNVTTDEGCFRIPFYSNPDQVYFGRPFGTANRADNARALRSSRWIAQDFSRGSGSAGSADAASDAAPQKKPSAQPFAGEATPTSTKASIPAKVSPSSKVSVPVKIPAASEKAPEPKSPAPQKKEAEIPKKPVETRIKTPDTTSAPMLKIATSTKKTEPAKELKKEGASFLSIIQSLWNGLFSR